MTRTLTRFFSGMASRWRAARLRAAGCRIEGRVWLRSIEAPRGHARIILSDGAALDRGVTLLVNGDETGGPAIVIGPRVYVNRHTMIDASERIEIGADTMIGPFVYITDHDHTAGPDGRPGSGPLVAKSVVIGERVWIGAHASILKGVRIGAGAVVGAGSVVTRDVPAGATVVGNPARVLSRTE